MTVSLTDIYPRAPEGACRIFDAVNQRTGRVPDLSRFAAVCGPVPAPRLATDTTYRDPIGAWEELLAGYMARGLSRQKAISAAASEHPQEHADYLKAFNSASPAERQAHQERSRVAATSQPTSYADPIAAWNEAVSQLQSRGLSKAQAISKLVRDQPEMHRAYLDQYNELHHEARGRGGK